MPNTIDSLQIEINAKASKANDAIDRLVGKLDRLTTSLGKINGTNLNGLANGVQRLGTAMQTMNNIKTSDFTRLAKNLEKLGTINVSALNSTASSMSHLTRAFNSLGTVSSNAQAVGDMAKNISKLGNKSVQTAITNIPQLAKALNNLMATMSRSPQVSQNVIQMTNALANLASQGSKVGTASKSITSGLNNSSTAAVRAKKSFSGLASAIGKFYATYFIVIRGLKGLWKSIESTADYIEAYNYFNVALGKIGSDWSYQFEQYGYDNAESYADSFGTRLSERLSKLSGLQVTLGADGQGLLTESGLKNLGLNIQEITQYASQLASVTNSVGQTGEVSLAAASAFTKLAGDISSLFNVDYSSVSKNLQSALIGQSRAVYKYGLDITQATLQTYAYNLGLSKSVSEMTQAEKMQLRMLAILDQSKVSWGDLANTINSPSNMIRQFTNNLKETGMVLGQLFIPILQKVLPVINGVTIAIKRLLVNIANLFGIKIDFDAFGQGYSDMEDGIEDVSSAYDDATSAAKKFKTTTLGIDELNINAPQEDTGKGAGGVSGGIDLTDEILKATEEYESVWNQAYEQMENEAQKFADKLENIFKTRDFASIGEYISNSIANGLNSINWDSVYQGARNFGTGLADFLNGLISPELFYKIGKTIANSLNTAIEFALSFAETFDFKNLGSSIAQGINGFFDNFNFRKLAKTLNKWVDGLKETLITAIKEINWSKVIKGAIDFVDELELDTIAIIIGAITFTLKRGAIKEALTKLGTTIIGYITLSNFGGSIVQFLKMDITSSIAMGTFASAGTAIGASLIAGIMAAIGGFKFGKFIGKLLNPSDKDLYENFTFFGDEGFFKTITENFQSTLDGLAMMASDFANNPVIAGLANVIAGPVVSAGLQIYAKKDEIKQALEDTAISIYEWWTNNVEPWFTLEKWSALLQNAKSAFSKKTTEIISDWKNNISSWWNKNVSPWFTLEKWTDAMQGIKEAFRNVFKNSANIAIDIFNDLIGWINDKMHFEWDAITIAGEEIVPAGSVQLFTIPEIPKFELGGFPEDGWFRASHGEIMGQFDNGQSVVANNMQIVDGISLGVREAVAEVLVPYLSDISRNTRETADKDMSVNIGDRDIARANARGSRLIGNFIVT